MSNQIDQTEWQQKAENLRTKFENLELKSEGLPEAARVDLAPKFSQVDTMLQALQRDANEATESTGADSATVQELGSTVELTLNNLQQEIEFLGTGNPTTVSAAIDATDELVTKAKEVIKTVTTKISLKSDRE